MLKHVDVGPYTRGKSGYFTVQGIIRGGSSEFIALGHKYNMGACGSGAPDATLINGEQNLLLKFWGK